ncbi:MAG: 4-alpha-glucanotransferase [Oscillospiraceae bacterium]|nr:4-alpha-glucanotransferase [Oscillospiraceae bacterium]
MRESGILMHITSLPGPYGIGTFGKSAYAFVDFLKKAGQRKWQILPLTPTGFGDSPYQSCSAFAGNPYLIDLPSLVQEGLLDQQVLDCICWNRTEDRVDFGLQYENRAKVLKMAYSRFEENEDFCRFCRENSSWLSDFSLFQALKDENGGAPWYQWDSALKHRDPDAVWSARRRLKDAIRFHSFVQYVFDKQWHALHKYANENGVQIIGDVPIYVPLDSVDVWSAPELYQLDKHLDPVAVAGCPPDAFSQDGQLWGNPLYRWDVHRQDKYGWWIRRMQAAAKRYDLIRIDHFRGFESYWSVPYGDTTARNGKWIKGPGLHFMQALRKALPDVQMIAEDLGVITPPVKQLRDEAGLPGMKVLQFAFDPDHPSDYLPHNCTPHTVCYTGTHDNMTLSQWLESLPARTLQYAARYMHLTEDEGYVWGVIRTAMSAPSKLCILQMQDALELGSDARMNFPGTQSGQNWTWRADGGFMTDALAEKIRSLTALYDRLANTGNGV